MFKCRICDKEFEKIQGLSTHILHRYKNKDKFHYGYTVKKYYDTYLRNKEEGICPTCGGETSFKTLGSGYARYCPNLKCRRCSEESNIKRKDTCLKKYGVDSHMKLESIKDKYKNKNKEKYGVEWSLSRPEVIKKRVNTCMKKFVNSLFDYNRLGGIIKPLFKKEDYKGGKILYKWLCLKCNTEFEEYIKDGKIPRCYKCYPIKCNSIGQKELFEFCSSFFNNIIENDRHILKPLEVDIFIPDIQLAIEFDGLYWHSELAGNNKMYHINKTLKANENNIRMIHIFEDEWIEKRELVKSILLNKFGKIKNKIYARNCKLYEVNNDLSKDFLEMNHIQGSIKGKSLGLFFENELVSLITLGKPRFSKKYDMEILRFCNKKNLSVVGSFSRLIKNVIHILEPNSIISYVDRRYNEGKSYTYVDFNYIGETPPSYFYLNYNNFKNRESRFKYQKHKLSHIIDNFDPNISEWYNMQANGYTRIWDCGNLVFSWNRRIDNVI